MSLRARLAIVTFVVTALALSVTGGGVWLFVRGYLYERLDGQLADLRFPAAGVLVFEDGGRPPPGVIDLAGTYVERRAADGTVRVSGFLTTATSDLPERQVPDLPALTAADIGRTFTVEGTGEGQDTTWRVDVSALRGTDPASPELLVLALPTDEEEATLTRLLLVELAVGVGVAALAALGGWWLAGIGLRPLRRIEDTAAAIAGGDLSQRVPAGRPGTEVGQLAGSLNTMLGQIEEAFAAREASERRLRRFVSDASHELRTPLTSIRGYAELYRRVGERDPEVVERSMTRIEAESTRMGRLVEDLLLLARLDEGRPLASDPVDLTALAEHAAGDLQVTEPQRPIVLDAPAPVLVTGDAERLTQVVANLLANVRAHTPPATPVTVSVRAHDGAGELVVADGGPGFPPDLAAHAFERFTRGDPSRTGEGTGLGLAIVASIVDAHGGTVVLEDGSPGARILVRLPLAAATPPDRVRGGDR